MKNSIFIWLMLFACVLPVQAEITKVEADSAYAREQYTEAVRMYETLLKSGVSASLYYNLGNAYYRCGDVSRAILSYERASLLSPGDADIRFNLELARAKTVDKIVPESEMFFVTWFRKMVNWTGADQWAVAALVCLVFFAAATLLFLFSGRILLRKTGFGVAVCTLLLAVLFHIFAYQQKQKLLYRTHAIVMSSSLPVRSTPSKTGTDLFVLHEGTKVEITDDTMKEWKEVRIPDGKVGWVPAESLERI